MPLISKEEDMNIRELFPRGMSENELNVIKGYIVEVKKRNGIYNEVIKFGGDLFKSKNRLMELTGFDKSSAGELARTLWRLANSGIEREKLIKIGIIHGIWIYEEFLCRYPSHETFNGKKILIKSGVKVGIFKSIYAGQLVGCNCSIKPVMPF